MTHVIALKFKVRLLSLEVALSLCNLTMDVSKVNSLSREDFLHIFGNIVERHTACASHLSYLRPFHDRQAFVNSALSYLDNLETNDVKQILHLHPDLVGRVAEERDLTQESQLEQRAAGLRSISPVLTEKLRQLNALYREKFGFPFIICARENKFEDILINLQTRLRNMQTEELQTALTEVKKIMSLRIDDLFKEP